MADFPFAIVGFDLDGTVLDTLGDLTTSLNFTLNSAGRRSLAAEQVKSLIGSGLQNTLRQALMATGGCDDATLPRLYQQMRNHYGSTLADTTQPYPGAIEAIEALRGRGVKVGMVTNKALEPAHKLLTMLGIRDLFDCLIGGDTLSVSKPEAAPIRQMILRCGGGTAAYVGDSYNDVMAAKNADIFSVVVSFGYHHGAIEDLGATAVIDDFGDLLPTLEQLGTMLP